MRVTIHQPEHIPWIGYFHKMHNVDIYVFLDSVQFKKNNWQNRNILVDRNKNRFWITVPVLTKGHLSNTISDIQIDCSKNWKHKYLSTIKQNYSKSQYFTCHFDSISSIITNSGEKLVDLNISLIEYIKTVLNIGTKTVRASELKLTSRRSELLLDICKNFNATEYLSGPTGKEYLDSQLFQENEVSIIYHSPSFSNNEISDFNVSILDILFNYGDKAELIIKKTKVYSL